MRAVCHFVVLALVGASVPVAEAQNSAIYKCKDDRRSSDRPIPGCKEQYVVNADGSIRGLITRPQTEDELSAEQERARIAAEKRKEEVALQRANRLLLSRYPNQASHGKARKTALETAAASVVSLERRIAQLVADRKALNDELEFYPNGNAPAKLLAEIGANEATQKGSKASLQNQQDEIQRIIALFDDQLATLRKLWKTTD